MTNALTAMNAMNGKKPPSIQEVEKKTDEYFAKLDVDGDKKITLREFKSFVKKDKQILEILLGQGVAKGEDMGTDFGSGAGAPDCDSDLENEVNPKELNRSAKKDAVKEGIEFKVKVNEEGDLYAEEEMGEGDQFMAVKPWKGVVDHSVPTRFKPSAKDGEAPEASLELEYVHGYRCHDTRNNVGYTIEGKLVYHAAALGIVHNQKSNTQTFFMEHRDDITAFALSPDKKYAATGNIGPKPLIAIWDVVSMECKVRITAPLTKGIKTLAFSPDGKYLAASAMDDDHMIAVWEWSAPTKDPTKPIAPIAHGKGSRAKFLGMGFTGDSLQVIGVCIKEINLFTFSGGKIAAKKVSFGKNAICAVPCCVTVDQSVFCGNFTGEIFNLSGGSIKETIKAHEGVVNAMAVREQGKGFLSGGKDGKIILWKYTAGKVAQELTINLNSPGITSLMPEVNALCHSASGNILCGTRGGEVMEFFPNDPKPKVHLRSHCKDELWGLATNPKNNSEFLTVGQDTCLAVWDIATRKQKKFAKMDCPATVVAYSNDGKFLAVGFTNGQLLVLNADSFATVCTKKDRKKEISEIKWSPDNQTLAAGGHDQLIITYDVAAKFKIKSQMRGHSSTILHL